MSKVQEVLQAIYQDGLKNAYIENTTHIPDTPEHNVAHLDDEITHICISQDELWEKDYHNEDKSKNKNPYVKRPTSRWSDLKHNAYAAGLQQSGHFTKGKAMLGQSLEAQNLAELAFINSLVE